MIIDKLSYQSNLRYVNACEKTVFAIVTLLLCVTGRSIVISVIVLAAMGFLTVKKGGTPFFRYVKLMTIPLAFLLMSTVAIILNWSKTPLDAFALPIGNHFLTSSRSSLFFGVQLILTALAGVSCLYFLSLSTPMPDILMALRTFRIPSLMVELMLLIYRFIFVLSEIAAAIRISQDSRLGNRNFSTSCKSFGLLGSALFVRAFVKSSKLYDSMESRLYDGKIRVLAEDYPPRKEEIALILLFELFLIVLLIWRYCL